WVAYAEKAIIAAVMENETFAESERLRRSGVTTLKYNKTLEGIAIPQTAEVYVEIMNVPVKMPGQPDSGDWYFMREIPPEEVQRRRMQESGLSPEQYAQLLDGMAQGLASTGMALNRGIADSGFGQILNPDDRMTAGRMYYGVGACDELTRIGEEGAA